MLVSSLSEWVCNGRFVIQEIHNYAIWFHIKQQTEIELSKDIVYIFEVINVITYIII